VFLASTRGGTPNVLLHHFKHNKVLHKQVVMFSVVTDAVPEVDPADSVHMEEIGDGFWSVSAQSVSCRARISLKRCASAARAACRSL
jgi:KUP system potassium uptake protein